MEQEKIWEYFQRDDVTSVAFNTTYARADAIAKLVSPSQKVLTIGIGKGLLEERLLAKGVDLYSVDPDESTVKRVTERLHAGIRLKVGYSQAIPFDEGEFDCVIMTEVLEHLEDDVINASLKEILRVLKPGGEFLGTVPAREVLEESVSVCPDCGKVFHRWGHVQSFDLERLVGWLDSVGFTDSEAKEVFFPAWRLLNWKGVITTVFKLALAHLGCRGGGFTILFKAKR